MNKYIKKTRRASNIGIFVSIAIIIATAAFASFCPYKFAQQPESVVRWLLISGIILSVLAVVMILLMIRKRIPQIRQLDDVDKKLEIYAGQMSNIYYSALTIIIIDCAIMVLMSDTVLLMIAMLLVLEIILIFPNMYKMKHDLGLNDEQMIALFGDSYIADNPPADAEPDLERADAEIAESEKEE